MPKDRSVSDVTSKYYANSELYLKYEHFVIYQYLPISF